MNRIFLISSCICITLSSFCHCQSEKYLPEELTKLMHNEARLARKAESIIKKDLVKNDIYNVFSVNSLLKDVEYFTVPMFNLKLTDTVNYCRVNNLLSYIEHDKDVMFATTILRKDTSFLGSYSCSDLNDYCSTNLYIKNKSWHEKYFSLLKELFSIEIRYAFYIRGILHAWWIVSDDNLKVFSFSDATYYEPQVFLDKNYTNESLKEIAEFTQKVIHNEQQK